MPLSFYLSFRQGSALRGMNLREQLRILLDVCNLCFNITKYSSNILVKYLFF